METIRPQVILWKILVKPHTFVVTRVALYRGAQPLGVQCRARTYDPQINMVRNTRLELVLLIVCYFTLITRLLLYRLS